VHESVELGVSLPDGHLQGVQGQVGAQGPASCQPTIARENASITRAA
jgi:hypothetical protein